MRRTLYTLLVLLALAATRAEARRFWPDSLNYTVRLGYNIGGTAPVGMPATIRRLNSYSFKTNFQLGIDAQKDLWGKWGLLAGFHIDNKAMEIDATVKNYHMEIVQGGERLEGMYTGRLVTQCDEWMATIPVQATWRNHRVLLKAGPYLSYVSTRSFKGHVYDGHLRKGDPTGDYVEMSNDPESLATYDFSADMRHWQAGITAGADWQMLRRLGLYADLSWGVTGVFRSNFHTIEQTLYPIFGTVGIIYRLR